MSREMEFHHQRFREQLQVEHPEGYTSKFRISFAVDTARRHPLLADANPDRVRWLLQTALYVKSRAIDQFDPGAQYIRHGGTPVYYQIANGPQGAPLPNNNAPPAAGHPAAQEPAVHNEAPQPADAANPDDTQAPPPATGHPVEEPVVHNYSP